MTSTPPSKDWRLSREVLVVMAMTLIGAVVRLWAPGRLGLVHFDEGIYALAGLWCFSPRGISAIDPTLIAYAPPGYPVLVGLAYLMLGTNDLAAILVSSCSGTLTIPLAAWLARRTFGAGAGGAAAAFAALSGPHVAFSRMALVDVSFLLAWLGAIGLGQRFLERPTPARAALFGCAVGLAQLFKYNGWIAGAIVVSCALFDLVLHPRAWRTRTVAATWGWGLVAAVVAAIVYWPWFAFVNSHGGYAALLAHQRSYLGGVMSWPGHLSQQLAEREFLSGGPVWLLCTGVAAVLAMSISQGGLKRERGFLPRIILEIAALTALCLIPGFLCWMPPVFISIMSLRNWGSVPRSAVLLAVGWAVLWVLTPFYHPYARLWLPIEAIGWLMIGGVFVGFRSSIVIAGKSARWTWISQSDRLPGLALASVAVLVAVISLELQSKKPRVRLLGPSDSLRTASRSVLSALPKEIKDLRVYARPPMLFYLALAGDISARRQPDLAHLLGAETSPSWAVLDMALVRQDHLSEKDLARPLARWVIVREIPTILNPPTLLDIDPAAARAEVINASAPVWLLRPRRVEDVR